jgi:hypothetical protein
VEERSLYGVSRGESVAEGSCRRRRGQRGHWSRRSRMNLWTLGGGPWWARGDFLEGTEGGGRVCVSVILFTYGRLCTWIAE